MSYVLRINNVAVDLFPNQDLSIEIDYYDTTNADALKIPFAFNSRIPYTVVNSSILDSYNYDNQYGNLTRKKYPYVIITKDGDVVSRGVVRVSSVVVNSSEPYYELEFKDSVSELSNALRELTFSELYDDPFSTQVRTLQTYLTSNPGYANRDIEIPFVDLDNIQDATGYEQRVFTSWGTTGKKYGLFPALKVTSFFERVFDKIGVNVSSKFLNNTSTWKPENLYVLYPTHLSYNPTNKRESHLFPFPYHVSENTNQWDGVDINVGGSTAVGISNYFLSLKKTYEPHGPTNYDPEASSIIEREYGDQFRTSTSVTDWGDENVGYVSYGSGFDAKFAFNSGNVTIAGLKACYLSTDYTDDNDNLLPLTIRIKNLNTAKFTPYVFVYESYTTTSLPTYKIPMLDTNGNQLKLTPTGFSDNTGIDNVPFGTTIFDYGTLSFPTFTAKIDNTISYPIKGGSTYSYAIGLEMVEGSLLVDGYLKLLVGGTTPGVSVELPNYLLTEKDVRKKRVFGYNWSILDLKVDNIGDLAATIPTDNFQFSHSFTNNESVGVYDLFVDLTKRFNLSIAYDYINDELIFDDARDLRFGIRYFDDYVDTLKPFEISTGELPPKEIHLLNKEQNGIYDKFESGLSVGSVKKELQLNGIGEKKIDFITSLINPINKSICQDPVPSDPILLNNGRVEKKKVGMIKNEMPDFDKVGLRIFYLKTPAYPTYVKYPVFKHLNPYGELIRQIVYEDVALVSLQGYPVNYGENVGEYDLRFADRDGNTFPAYDLMVNNERFLANTKNKMTFYAAIPDFIFSNGEFLNKTFRFRKTQEDFLVNSITDARLYDGWLYGKFEIIFL